MLKNYQIKWYFVVTGILTCVTTLSLLLTHDRFNGAAWWEYPIYVLRLAVIFFVCWIIHGTFLVHKISGITNYTKYVLSNVIATLATFTLDYLFFFILPSISLSANAVPFDSIPNIIVHFISSFLANIVAFAVLYSVYANSILQNTQLEKEILERAHLRAQLISLQQQISPHFLFNSLSTLKTLTKEKPTKDYIVKLAAVYRYVLNYNQQHLTPLKEELNFIKAYLYIMDQRFEAALKVQVDIPEAYLNYLIPPLSLQLLVENAVKHNTVSFEQPLFLNIVTDCSPALIVSNNVQLKRVAEESTGMGIKNIEERYRLLVNRPVQIVHEDGHFAVTLPLIKK